LQVNQRTNSRAEPKTKATGQGKMPATLQVNQEQTQERNSNNT
jgi:hypothetical protein